MSYGNTVRRTTNLSGTLYGMSSGPIWTRRQPGERRASLTREQIATTAVALADAEGPDALSMRRLAQALGVGTMTLYGYVRTKQDLFALVDDTIMAELVIPEDEFPGEDWRAALTAIAIRSRQSFDRHPWILRAMGTLGSRLGPNAMRHFDQTVRAVAQLGLTPAEKLDLTSLIDEYVFGYATNQAFETGMTDDVARAELRAWIDTQIATGDYPHIDGLFPPGTPRDAAWEIFEAVERDNTRFERGLRRLLDGIELELRERGVIPPRG